jgi:GDP-L-fucose synthase
MKCLLLGGTGFIGSNIQAQRPTWSWTSVGTADCDLTNQHELYKLHGNYDIVINAAGFYGGLPFNSKYQREILFRNTTMINNIARLVNDLKPAKFVNVGSGCLYPRTATDLISENAIGGTDFHPSIQYSAMTKNWLLQVTEKLDVPWEYLILSNVYGPGEHLTFERSHFIGSLANKIKNSTGRLDMLGDGSSVRDFIYVTDTVEAICKYCELDTATNSVSNISTGHGSTISDVVKQLVNISQRDLVVNWGDPHDNGVLYKVLDNRKMQQDIGYNPSTRLAKGLANTWNWIQSI